MLLVRVHSNPTSLRGIDLSLASIRAVARRVFRSLRMFGTVYALQSLRLSIRTMSRRVVQR